MAVSYFAEDVKMPAIKKREPTDWIRRVASGYGKKCGDIAYIFCSDERKISPGVRNTMVALE